MPVPESQVWHSGSGPFPAPARCQDFPLMTEAVIGNAFLALAAPRARLAFSSDRVKCRINVKSSGRVARSISKHVRSMVPSGAASDGWSFLAVMSNVATRKP